MDLNMNPLNVEFPATSISLENGQKTEEVTVLPVSPEQYNDNWGKVRKLFSLVSFNCSPIAFRFLFLTTSRIPLRAITKVALIQIQSPPFNTFFLIITTLHT